MKLSSLILYEDKDVLVLNKPAGLAVHGDGKAPRRGSGQVKEKTLADYIFKEYPALKKVGEPLKVKSYKVHKVNKVKKEEKNFQLSTFNFITISRPGIVHRLDKDTSGVLIVAKNQKAFLFLKKQFQNREIKKTYWAIVWGWPRDDRGIINRPIGRSQNDFRQRSAKKEARGELREAITRYRVVKRFMAGKNKVSLLEVYPQTGRTHQIRVHLRYLNHPVICDELYGVNKTCLLGMKRLALHAKVLEITLPSKKLVKFEAPLPADFQKAVALGGRTA